jgi:probable F420-dependent oxidoreductase
MRFTLSVAMFDPAQYFDIARTADECGWDSIAVPDSPLYPEVVTAKYPYTPDGSRFLGPDCVWIDPWVSIPAMAAITKRIRFYTAVLKMAIRQPLLVAKTVGSAAVLSNDRVGLGVGLSWMPEEFKYLSEDWDTRAGRLDEAIQIIRLVLGGGMVEFHGRYYDFDRLQMSPAPERPVPIYVGGVSKPALRRAARHGDGWISVVHSEEEIRGFVADLNRYRREIGREKEPFSIMVHCPDAHGEEDLRRLEDLGVTDFQHVPWMLYGGDVERLDVKLDGIKRYADEVIAKFH